MCIDLYFFNTVPLLSLVLLFAAERTYPLEEYTLDSTHKFFVEIYVHVTERENLPLKDVYVPRLIFIVQLI